MAQGPVGGAPKEEEKMEERGYEEEEEGDRGSTEHVTHQTDPCVTAGSPASAELSIVQSPRRERLPSLHLAWLLGLQGVLGLVTSQLCCWSIEQPSLWLSSTLKAFIIICCYFGWGEILVPKMSVSNTPTESGALRIKTNNAVPSALMSLSLFLLFRKWNALVPNPSQCWLGRAPLPVFWAH